MARNLSSWPVIFLVHPLCSPFLTKPVLQNLVPSLVMVPGLASNNAAILCSRTPAPSWRKFGRLRRSISKAYHADIILSCDSKAETSRKFCAPIQSTRNYSDSTKCKIPSNFLQSNQFDVRSSLGLYLDLGDKTRGDPSCNILKC